MQQSVSALQTEYDHLQENWATMTPWERERAAEDIKLLTNSLQRELANGYFGGQQTAVNQARGTLELIDTLTDDLVRGLPDGLARQETSSDGDDFRTGKSQAYAEYYHVVAGELSHDKKDSDIYDPKTGYFKNPTATRLEDAALGNSILLDGKKANGQFIYIVNEKGEIILGKRSNPIDPAKRSPHPTLIGGKDPQVQVAGMITFREGKIYSIDNQNGHYKPNIQSMQKVENALKKLYELNPKLFHKKSKWRK